jgi:hypothetical protein
MKEDNNIPNWREKNDDDLNVNEEASEQVEETTEEAIEEVEEVAEEEIEDWLTEEEAVEEVAEAISVASVGYELYGTDKELVNHVEALIHDLNKSVTIVDNHTDLKGGNVIILCGDDWDAFVKAGESNAESKSPVIQLQCEMNHSSMDAGYKTAAHAVWYDQDEDKATVAKKICNLL